MSFEMPTVVQNQSAQTAQQAAHDMKVHLANRNSKSFTGRIKSMIQNGALFKHWAFVFSVVMVFVFLALLILRPSFVMNYSPDGTFSFSVGKAIVVSAVFAGIAAVLAAHM